MPPACAGGLSSGAGRRLLQQLAHRLGDVGIRVVGDAAPERIVEEVERERLQFWKALAFGAAREMQRVEVSAFLLSGEVLRHRYQLDVAQVGMSVTAFGIGLGVGNLSAGRLRRLTGSEECSLIVVTILLTDSIAGLCQVQCWRLFELVMQRSPSDYRAKPASLQRYQSAMRPFSRAR
ncbi:hypothetical protein [Burkholderia gladioli]|uniref:hypothetical protein n=1 Tax=Burkholderia gladioli TaxID=28095 RepID=UPI001640C29A|nr:hypothetical protein [Burkholderia gladioli]